MAPRRPTKKKQIETDTITAPKYDNLTVSDVICPICRSILIEPVSLPCNHSFCSACFHETMANVNLVCPLCRMRIGSWLRRAHKGRTMVNDHLWTTIQQRFAQQVQNKRDGIDEELEPEADAAPKRVAAAPGELRREYQLQKAKEELEVQQQRQAEIAASESYIRKLKEMEEYERAMCEENDRLSEQVAKELAQELFIIDPGPSTSKMHTNHVAKTRPKNGDQEGPLEKLVKNMVDQYERKSESKNFTCKIMCQGNGAHPRAKALLSNRANEKVRKLSVLSVASDSNDSIRVECTYFKPIKPIEQRQEGVSAIAHKVAVVKPVSVCKAAISSTIVPPSGTNSFFHSKDSSFVSVNPPIADDDVDDDECSNHTDLKRKLPTSHTSTASASKALHFTPSKRRCINSDRQEGLKLDSSPPFRGFSNHRNGFAFKETNGGAKCDKGVQEAEDLKYARKLHEELNGCRYSTRSTINNNNNNNHSKQLTLHQMVSQKVAQVP